MTLNLTRKDVVIKKPEQTIDDNTLERNQNQTEQTRNEETINFENHSYTEDIPTDQEETNNKIPYFITVQYCNKSNLHTTYQTLEKRIYHQFPKTRLEVQGIEYPVPDSKKFLAQIATYTQYAIFASFFFYKNIFAFFKIPVPQIIEQIAQKRFIVVMVVMLLSQQIQSLLLVTQKMAVYVDDRLVYETTAKDYSMEDALDMLSKYVDH